MHARLKTTATALVAMVLAALPPRPMSAQVTTFTNRSAFTAAIGAPAYFVDFESFSADACFSTSAVDAGPFSLLANGYTGCTSNLVDAAPFVFDAPVSFGNAIAQLFVMGDQTVDLFFDTPANAFFADFWAAGNGQPLNLELLFDDASTFSVSVPGIGTGAESFGFTSTSAITRIRFRNVMNDGFAFDNVAIGTAVPEPSTFALLASGLLMVGMRARRRRGA